MTRRNVRRLFAAALLFLPVQYGLVGLASLMGLSEPWPAVVLPGFQSVLDRTEHVEVRQAAFEVRFADGSMESLSPAEVFRPLPPSHHLGMLRRQFMPASISGTPRTEQAVHPDTRMWLRSQVNSLFPARPIEQIDVVWYLARYGPNGAFWGAAPVDTLHLPLTDLPRR